jgi:hypothetical protein
MLRDAMRRNLAILLAAAAALPAIADAPLVAREPFAKAHVAMMARSQAGESTARMVDVDVYAEGTRLHAKLRDDPKAGEFWVDGLASPVLRFLDGKLAEPRRRTLEHALQLALAASPSLANANTDRIAGHPCKIVSEELPGGISLTRCIWRGLPLSVELHQGSFSFNAAAMMVEEGAVSVADLQPPPGAPAAQASLSAGR